MKVYITKYALTKGIIETEGTQSKTSPDLLVCKNLPNQWKEGLNWHRDLMNAVDRVMEMRTRKIKSLEKQIERLWNMDLIKTIKPLNA